MNTTQLTKCVMAEKQVKSVYRLRTTCWSDNKSLHVKRSLTLLRRLSTGGHDHLIEEVDQVGAYDAVEMITNLAECEDGVYVVDVVEKSYNYESGLIEDWAYRLVPYTFTPPEATS
jgi:hypothetical protein